MTDLVAHTLRLELVDEPGELLRALEPIADRGGNLLSVFHERGNVTPRGQIPIEIALECPPGRFEDIVEAVREAGVNVVKVDTERYGERVTVLLVGHLIDTDLSGTLSAVESCAAATIVDVALSAPEGTDGVSTARLDLAVEAGGRAAALSTVRSVAEEKDLSVIEPVGGGAGVGTGTGAGTGGTRADGGHEGSDDDPDPDPDPAVDARREGDAGDGDGGVGR